MTTLQMRKPRLPVLTNLWNGRQGGGPLPRMNVPDVRRSLHLDGELYGTDASPYSPYRSCNNRSLKVPKNLQSRTRLSLQRGAFCLVEPALRSNPSKD